MTTKTKKPKETPARIGDSEAYASWQEREPYALPDPNDPRRLWLFADPPAYYCYKRPCDGKWLLIFRWFDIPAHPDLSGEYDTAEEAVSAFMKFFGRGDYTPSKMRRLFGVGADLPMTATPGALP
jgi:hypothetical protein